MFIKKEIELRQKLPENISHSLFSLFDIFHNAKAELYLVGGCVRDLLLDKLPKDYDLCTNLTPEQIKQILTYPQYSFIDTGLKHGTITVHDQFDNQFFEITTYRIDGDYLTSRYPESISFTGSLEEDLKRRDFTVNSFAYDLTEDVLVMLDEAFIYDLKFGIIRTVGDPLARFGEDALRILRAIRFASQLNFSIESLTYRAMTECVALLKNISKERIRDELTKILLSDNPQYLEFITTIEAEQYLFDGVTPITDMVKCDHENPWHYTSVFHHTVDVVKNVSRTFNSRWAAFFHDIGKPKVKALKPGTTNHYRYIGHPEASVEIADSLMDLLKFSNDQKDIIHKFVLYHDYPLSDVSDKKFKRKIVEIGEDNFLEFLALRQADGLAHKLDMSTGFAIDAVSKCKERYMRYLMHPEPLRLKDLAVNGDDIKNLGVEGKQIGEILNYLLERVLDRPQLNDKIVLINIVKNKFLKQV